MFYFQRLTEAAQAKMDVEDRLLGSFVDILNGKKRKISELTLEGKPKLSCAAQSCTFHTLSVDRLREQLKSGPAEAMDVDESAAAYEPSGEILIILVCRVLFQRITFLCSF